MADPKMEQKIFQLVLETLTRERGGASQSLNLAEVDRSRVSRWHGGRPPLSKTGTRFWRCSLSASASSML